MDYIKGGIIYVSNVRSKRILRIIPYEGSINKITIKNVKTISTSRNIPYDVLENCRDFSYNLMDGFIHLGPLDDEEETSILDNKLKIVIHLEALDALKKNIKSQFIRPLFDEDLYDPVIMYDIHRYETSNVISPLLASMYEYNNLFTNIEHYVSFLKMKYEDFNHQLAYLYNLEKKARKLIENNKFEKFAIILKEEYEKRLI
jgi:hypothetical protein